MSTTAPPRRPTLRDLGADLTRVSALRRGVSLAGPFLWFGGYWVCAAWADDADGWWAGAVGCTVGLSFVTYGSVSHDLVHRTLGLPRATNRLLLTVVELLAFGRDVTEERRAHDAIVRRDAQRHGASATEFALGIPTDPQQHEVDHVRHVEVVLRGVSQK